MQNDLALSLETKSSSVGANEEAAVLGTVENLVSRRELLAWSSAILGAVACNASLLGQPVLGDEEPSKPARSRQLVRPRDVQQLITRNKMVLELDGKLFVNEEDKATKRKKRDADVKAKSTLEYYELTALNDQAGCIGVARQYTQGEAEHWVSGNKSSAKLREACFDTLVLKHQGTWQQYCEKEPLAIEEVELLTTPLNSQSVDLLLPETPAKAHEPWTISSDAAKELFNLEAAFDSSLTAKISKVESGVATVDLTGVVHGTANSVPTELQVKGSFQAKLASQCAIVSWVGLTIEEKRSISQAEPGFTISARVRLLREEGETELEKTREDLLALAAESAEARWLVRTGSVLGRYTFLAGRNWKTYIDTGDESIYRLVVNNVIVSQCNVTRLPSFSPGKQLTLEALQAEIRQSLGGDFQSFLEASEKVTSSKLRLMRVVVSGAHEDVPIQWIYSHLSDDKGRRISLVFTMGGNVVDQFASADEQICDSFELHPDPPKTEGKPEDAPKLSEAAKPAKIK